MGRNGGSTPEHAMAEIVRKSIMENDNLRRKNDIEDAEELMSYKSEMDSQPMVVLQKSVNINLNINITSETHPSKIQEIFNIINSNQI